MRKAETLWLFLGHFWLEVSILRTSETSRAQLEGNLLLRFVALMKFKGGVKSPLSSVQVKDYPGLLRVIAWVFNGLELVVKKAR